jgi:hypothetical protein
MYLQEFLELLIATIKCRNNKFTSILLLKDGVIVGNIGHKTIITLCRWYFNVLIFSFSFFFFF